HFIHWFPQKALEVDQADQPQLKFHRVSRRPRYRNPPTPEVAEVEGAVVVDMVAEPTAETQRNPNWIWQALRVPAEFFHCIHHRKDIFRWDIRHDGVDRGNHIATLSAQYIDHTLALRANFIWRAKGQNAVSINCSTKDQILPKLFLESFQIRHFPCRGLNRVQDIHSHFDK